MRTMVIIPPLKEASLARIQAVAPDCELLHGLEGEALREGLARAEIVCGWNNEVAEVCAAESTPIQWIQVWGAGVDRLPLSLLARRNMVLTTASGVHPHPVSETALAMMLAFSRKLNVSIRQQMNHHWENPGGLTELHGKTMGIIGVGSIGVELARLAQAFGMKTLGVRRTGARAESVDRMYDLSGLDTVLAESDVVVAIMPLTDESRHMFGREQFAIMKPGAVFINVSRGATVDTEALVEALRQGEIAGAGLDVFEEEPLPPEHPLWEFSNVIITPHTGGMTDRYEERALEIFAVNLEAWVKGERLPLNQVELNRQY
ncbi:D-2-hydroxyacid dehydrogenase [Paenibacillus daejeonensis]|uniref:D-2-hydroxyacid dehydrogenase n=1 Tax=Paenibacillus daejeonensis TaxID=135193 RepID=UPI000361F62B|nr:D-2-hydroxyacid dehydrogenase [Paenibacillus daejeonensis]